jgi:sensor histidine kinase YesM
MNATPSKALFAENDPRETISIPPAFPPALTWTILFLIYTAFGILLTSYTYLDDLSRDRSGTFLRRLLEEGTGTYAAFALLPLVLRFTKYNLFGRSRWTRRIILHLLAAVLLSAAHTSLMALSRQVLAPLIGLGRYDYGIMLYRYPMEFSNYLIGFTFITVFYYLFQRFRLAQAHQLAASELQTKLAQAQLENLRLQLQPHFLFNTLNTISSVMYEDVRAADAMITELSDLLRLTLNASRSHEIRLSEELHITRLYLGLMQKRFEDKLLVTYSVDSVLESSLVPQLILQPLLENSLRHGMQAGCSTMELNIAAHRDNGSLVLQVSDTGAGLNTQASVKGVNRGVGLANVRNRLSQMYGGAQDFSIANRATGGVQVTLRLPNRSANSEFLSPGPSEE